MSKENQNNKLLWVITIAVIAIAIVVGFPVLGSIKNRISKANADSVARAEKRIRDRLQSIASCEYLFEKAEGRYGTLQELFNKGCMEPSEQVYEGYHFEIKLMPHPYDGTDFYQAAAWPVNSDAGSKRSFYYDHYNGTAEEASSRGTPPEGFR